MAETGTEALILQDKDGNYYMLPRELVDMAIVADDRRDVIEDLIGDVEGFGVASRPNFGTEGPGFSSGLNAVGWVQVKRPEQLRVWRPDGQRALPVYCAV